MSRHVNETTVEISAESLKNLRSIYKMKGWRLNRISKKSIIKEMKGRKEKYRPFEIFSV